MNLPLLNPTGYVIGTGLKTRCQRGNRGWDVFSLQRGLLTFGFRLPVWGADGSYGEETVAAVRAFQKAHGLDVDGWGGPTTQKKVMTLLIDRLPVLPTAGGLPRDQARVHLSRESGLLTGNHSAARKPRATAIAYPYKPDANGNYFDNGGGQMASEYHTYEEAYHPQLAVRSYFDRMSKKYKEYKDVGFITVERRLRELAVGSWNAPSWTDRLARGQSISSDARAAIEAYIDRMTEGVNLG